MTELFEKLNIKPKNIKIYQEAFMHNSYAQKYNLKYNYGRLEYLGASVLRFSTSDILYRTFDQSEGVLAKLRDNYVCYNACYTYANSLGLCKYIKASYDEKNNALHYRGIVADVFESFIGAIYIDLGFEQSKQFVYNTIEPYIENNVSFLNNYKTQLQGLVNKRHLTLRYRMNPPLGKGKPVVVRAKINGVTYGTGVGYNKKEAEKAAAKEVLVNYFHVCVDSDLVNGIKIIKKEK